MRLIGGLIGANEGDTQIRSQIAAFREELAKLGWIEGRNLQVDLRFASGDPERMRTHASELVSRRPDVIFVSTPAATRAVQQQTQTIPIVFVGIGDPVVAGVVASTARPEGNATGFTNFLASFGKRSKSRGGVILRSTGRRESDSFWECCRSRILTISRTLT